MSIFLSKNGTEKVPLVDPFDTLYPLRNLFNLLETNSRNFDLAFISGSLKESFKMVSYLPCVVVVILAMR